MGFFEVADREHGRAIHQPSATKSTGQNARATSPLG
jgi:hypothetical protein